jgi:orotate phosphoribosyltransferase
LRDGHFRYPNGLHSDQYLQIPLAMRVYQHQKMLSVALSRLVRANPEIRAIIPELSIICPATGGLPIAYSLCEALRAKQVYWAEQDSVTSPLKYRQFLEQEAGEKVLLVDDILRSGSKLRELRKLVEGNGAEVIGLAVVVYQPTPQTADFGDIPLYYLANLGEGYFGNDNRCELCDKQIPLQEVWV